MKHTTSAGKRSLIGALALSLMLGFGVCRPAATASAEDSLLAEHKDEIVDTIVNARENLRSTIEDLRSIRDAVKAREAEKANTSDTSKPTAPTAPTAPSTAKKSDTVATSESTYKEVTAIQGDQFAQVKSGESRESTPVTQPQAAAEEPSNTQETSAPAETSTTEAETPATEPETGSDSQTPSSGEGSGSSLADKLRERLSSEGGLINIDISDVDATLRDNPIEHDILVESDFLNDNSIEHDWSVSVDNSRFNNNTFIRQYSRDSAREYNPRPAAPVDYTYSTAPKTGDANNIGLWVAVVGVSAAALAATLVILKKRKG